MRQMTAKKMSSFGSRMIAFDLYPDEEAARRLGVEMVDMDTLLAESDIFSIHVPSIPETYHAINADTLSKMKPSACIINTARGPIIDEAALYEALKCGKIGSAAVDVYEQEPASPENPLFTLPNFTGTPHTAADTYENNENCGMITAQAIIDYFGGKEPINRVV